MIDDDTKITDLFTELSRERYEVEVAGTGLDGRIPVVMVTANDDLAATERVLKSGALAYLPKPFQIPYALHLVEAALFEAPKPRSARGPAS